mgnify:CR=1 FL=1
MVRLRDDKRHRRGYVELVNEVIDREGLHTVGFDATAIHHQRLLESATAALP